MEKSHIVALRHKDKIETFVDGDKFFSFKGAKDFVKFSKRLYPKNKGEYMVFEIKRVHID